MQFKNPLVAKHYEALAVSQTLQKDNPNNQIKNESKKGFRQLLNSSMIKSLVLL